MLTKTSASGPWSSHSRPAPRNVQDQVRLGKADAGVLGRRPGSPARSLVLVYACLVPQPPRRATLEVAGQMVTLEGVNVPVVDGGVGAVGADVRPAIPAVGEG